MVLPLLTIHDGELSFSVKPLFQGLDVNILENDHLCLIGRNGQGKSTLLKVLKGSIDLDKGDFYKKPGKTIHYLPQELDLPQNKTAFEVVMENAKESYIAEQFLDHLEVNPNKKVNNCSGGEKRRILLAKTLSGNPDLLLLDEPTNHLDIKAIRWLEDYLNSFKSAILTISHDRRFLENTAKGMLLLENRALKKTDRSYNFFETWCQELEQTQQSELKKIKAKLRLEEHWKNFGVTARRKRNQGRLEKLFHLRERRKNLLSDQKKRADITKQEKAFGSQLVVEAKQIEKSYSESLHLEPFSTRIFKGDRIGIIGANGSGKSTLLKMLMGTLSPDKGNIRLGKTIDIAYFDQERMEMNPKETLWQYLCPQGGDQVLVQNKTMHVVGYLKQFMFDDKDARSAISTLSGGQKNRLQLAKTLAQKSNVLILDEPTNDLDMDTLDLLIDNLTHYEGTLILISHDRDFIDQLTTAVFAIHPDGKITDNVGGFSEYEKNFGLEKLLGIKEPPSKNKDKKETNKNAKKSNNKLTYNDQRNLEKIPKLLKKIEQEIQRYEEKLQDPNLYITDPISFDGIAKKLEDKKAEQKNLEHQWLEISMNLE